MLSTMGGIGLSLWDKVSDLVLGYQLYFGTYEPNANSKAEPQVNFAIATLLPVLSSLLFQIYQWVKYEKSKKETGIFVPLLIYPQICEIRLLNVLFRRKKSWNEKKQDFQLRLSCLGKSYLLILYLSTLQ